MPSIEIKRVHEHYEVYKDGVFIFSADSMQEVVEGLEENNF